jgi:hypothetical protein
MIILVSAALINSLGTTTLTARCGHAESCAMVAETVHPANKHTLARTAPATDELALCRANSRIREKRFKFKSFKQTTGWNASNCRRNAPCCQA